MGDTKKLLSNSFIVFSGSITASVFSYLFNMLMGRLLGPNQYGEMAAILSMINVFTVIGGVVITTTMLYVGELYGQGNLPGVKKFGTIFARYIFAFSLFLLLIGFAIVKPTASFFSVDHLAPVFIAFLTFIFGFVILVSKGILQGTQRFTAFSFINILESVLKVVLGIILVKAGFALGGAILATVLATAVTYFVAFWPISHLFKNVKNDEKVSFHFKEKDVLVYSIPVLLSSLLLAVVLNLDIILVKHYFPSKDAGLYAALSTVAKIILYLTSPIISVMFPMITEKRSRGEKHYKMLFLSMAITAIGALVVLGIYSAFPNIVMKILYGNGYTGLSYLLPQLGVFVFFYTLANLMANYFLAIKKFSFIYFMAAISILAFVWSALYHPNILGLIKIFIICNGLLLASMIGYYFQIKWSQIIQFLQGAYEP